MATKQVKGSAADEAEEMVMDSLTIRHAKITDLPAIEALLRDAGLPTDGLGAIAASAPGDVLVAEGIGGIVGAAAIEVAGTDALLRSVVVRREGRSAGIGRTMVTRLLAEADRRRYDGVYLLTTTAGDWFPQFGFTRVERKSVPKAIAETWEFKTGCGDTAIVMARRKPK